MYPSQTGIDHWEATIERFRPEIEAYADVLRRYVALIDGMKNYTVLDFLKALDLLLPEVYLASRRLAARGCLVRR
jgi:hypothetical protein